jgi:uncharacterized membrane protein
MSQRKAKENRQLARRTPEEVASRRRDDVPTSHQQELFPTAIRLGEASTFSGPLPPPDLLSEYNQVLPGLAERIVQMTEKQGDHRRHLQSRAMRLSEAGLVSAFLLALVVLVGGFVLVSQDRSLEGMTSVIGALASLMIVYLTRGRRPPER